MPETIECPSGLVGEVRGLKVKEFNILANRRLAKGGQQLDQVLRSCWLQTVDPGPYNFADQPVNWDHVLQGDRFFALLKIRSLSLGADYAFTVGCQNDACRERFEWEISLEDLPIRALSEEARAAFQAGNRFETQLSDGRRIWFRLAVGGDERRFAGMRQSNRDRLWSSMLALRIVEIENVKDSEKRRFIEDLEVQDAEHLRDEFDRVDCGVETTIEVECPECFTVQEVELPLDQGFFVKSTKQRRKRRRPGTSSPF